MSNDQRTAELLALLKEAQRYCPVHVQERIDAAVKKDSPEYVQGGSK